ncbi:MAG TPA: DPP IV N-terminal domain-containing protein, partial [Gemmatimonadales bacterium]|nr:DPP IV N-terminal domain-containing protein [Gemmatimonadales bacterium]
GGRRFSYTQRGDSGDEIRAVDPATGADSLLFTANGLQFPDTNEAFSYQSFQWSRDSKFLVFQTRFKRIYRRSGTADYFVYSLAGRKLQLAARGARTAELSPDGTTLGYERGGDLYTYTLAQKKEKRLTLGATDLVHNGRFDWVYEEEFGKAQAWNWSPDSRYIAYWQVDESPEPVVQFSDYQGWHPDWERIRIPSVGDSNARVRIGVVNVTTGRRVWLDPREQGEYYVPRLYWTSRPDTLAMLTLNRPQSVLKLWFFDARNGGRRLVHTWQSDTWIDVYDFYSNVLDMMTFPEGQDEFLWISDQDGWQHIYRYGYDGKLIKQVTRGPWSVTRIEGVDPKAEKIYYTSTEATPLERQLYVIDMDGGNKTQLTTTAGTHEIDMSPDTRYYIDSWSSTRQPRQVELWATGGAMLKKMEDNAAVSQWLESHVYSPAELFSFTTSDSVKLDGSIIKPPAFDSTRRYPVVFDIYGGPGSQQVYNEFATSTWAQWLAQQGYVVIGLNNRGSNNYGAAFEKIVYDHLGRWESHD